MPPKRKPPRVVHLHERRQGPPEPPKLPGAPEPEPEPLPETPSDKLYFEAKRTVFERELLESLRARDYATVERVFVTYGSFFERYPSALGS